MKSKVFVLFLLIAAGPVAWAQKDGAAKKATVTMARPDQMEAFPSFEICNSSNEAWQVRIESSLENPKGEISKRETATYALAAGETKVFPAYKGKTTLTGQIALLRSCISQNDGEVNTISAIVGTPQPVPRGQDCLVGMNVHLDRYTPEEQWRVLQMMRDAGVTSLRIEPRFRSPDKQGRFSIPQKIDESLLGAEAFGMNPMMALTYFPEPFYKSEEKAAMAYQWARFIGERYKGRVYDYHYGNETNSGWAAYGAAADMVVHHQAMTLGSLAADPLITPSTLGIAEGLPNYLRELFRNGLGPYMKAVSIHPYCGVAESGIAKGLANRQVINEFGGRQSLWLTEIGFQVSEPGSINPVTQQLTLVNGFSLDQQADQMARLFILSRASGIDRVYYYNFFGKGDRETFWLVDGDFQPRPAYVALKYLTPFLKGATPLGGTPLTEAVQRHLFRRPDGSVFLVAWAQRNNVKVDLGLPLALAGKGYKVSDILGNSVDLDLSHPVTLGERPLFIEGLPADTKSFELLEVLANGVDGRNWNKPMQRWNADAGSEVTVPCVVFNSGTHAITAHPVWLNRYPGWKVTLPPAFEVPAGQTVTKQIQVTIPADVVPGVEYRPSFAVETSGPRRTTPFEARIWVNGDFPYGSLLVEEKTRPGYPMRRIVDEGSVGFGREETVAKHGTAKVDGDLSDWDAAEFVTLDQIAAWKLRDVSKPMRENWYARAALRWDEKYLYFAYIVLDDDLSITDLTSRDWRDSDNVRLFLSRAAESERTKTISEKELLLFMTPTRQFHDEAPAVMTASLGGYVRTGFEPHVKIASRIWHGGYLIEAAIPFAEFGVTPSAGLTLGCNILGDDADGGFRVFAGMTTFKNLDYWNSPKSLGTLRLVP